MSINKVILIFAICSLAFTSGAGIGISVEREIFRKTAVEHGCAEYNRTTGKWQWISADQ